VKVSFPPFQPMLMSDLGPLCARERTWKALRLVAGDPWRSRLRCSRTFSHPMDLFAKLLEKRFDRQPCGAGILYECMRFLIGHYKVNAAEEFLSLGVFARNIVSCLPMSTVYQCRLVLRHGILLDPEASILCPFQPALQGAGRVL